MQSAVEGLLNVLVDVPNLGWYASKAPIARSTSEGALPKASLACN